MKFISIINAAPRATKYASRSIYKSVKMLTDDNIVVAIGIPNSKNWGDALNPVLIQKISGKIPLIVTTHTYNIRNIQIYSVIGSTLGLANTINCGHKNLIIWGSGFISSKKRLKVHPSKICAVRGPLTRELILKQGYKCPEIYGDPALLYPKFYKPNVQKNYKLGIIPHAFDKAESCLNNFQNDPDILIIDILGGINNVIDQICSCEKIASSSLHGIIAADAYGVQSTWIKLSDKVTGDGFKFIDYFRSVGRIDENPLVIKENSSVEDILSNYYKYKLDIDLNELLDACPLRS